MEVVIGAVHQIITPRINCYNSRRILYRSSFWIQSTSKLVGSGHFVIDLRQWIFKCKSFVEEQQATVFTDNKWYDSPIVVYNILVSLRLIRKFMDWKLSYHEHNRRCRGWRCCAAAAFGSRWWSIGVGLDVAWINNNPLSSPHKPSIHLLSSSVVCFSYHLMNHIATADAKTKVYWIVLGAGPISALLGGRLFWSLVVVPFGWYIITRGVSE